MFSFLKKSLVPSVDVGTLQEMLAQSNPPLVLDVREASEVMRCHLPQSLHIPLGELAMRAAELPKDRPIVVQCHHGGRSARATAWLLENGFTDVRNLTGGIDAWAQHCAPEMERY